MASIYDADFSLMVDQLTPPDKRTLRNLAWQKVFAKSIQYYHDILFPVYIDSFTGSLYVPANTYVKGDQVRASDHAVYEALQAVPINTQPADNPTYWLKVLNVWVGVRERQRYTGQKLVLEYALNKWFDTIFRQPTANVASPVFYTPKSDIYIDNNSIIVNQFRIANNEVNGSSFIMKNDIYGQDGIPIAETQPGLYAFTIKVPILVFNSLASNNTDRENVIRNFADLYVYAGITYKIETYP